MDPHSSTFAALCVLALILGMKHGLDADHLATIDGLARCSAARSRFAAKLSGVLFSAGHGLVVVLVTLVATFAAASWHTPAWLEVTGLTVSVAFLFGLAYVNLLAAWRAAPDTVVAPVGLRARLLARFFATQQPWAIAAIGALFALSFDTVSQAALFALAATKHGGVGASLFLALLFVAGMMAVDGINGLWVARMLRRMDRRAAIASRAMAATVGILSATIGVFTVAKRWLPGVESWAEGRERAIGAAVVAVVAIAWACAMLLSRDSQRPDPGPADRLAARG